MKFRAIALAPDFHSNNISFPKLSLFCWIKISRINRLKGLELSIRKKSILARSYELTLRVLRSFPWTVRNCYREIMRRVTSCEICARNRHCSPSFRCPYVCVSGRIITVCVSVKIITEQERFCPLAKTLCQKLFDERSRNVAEKTTSGPLLNRLISNEIFGVERNCNENSK